MSPLAASLHFDVSRTGTLVYRKQGAMVPARLTTVQWLDAAGKTRCLPNPVGMVILICRQMASGWPFGSTTENTKTYGSMISGGIR